MHTRTSCNLTLKPANASRASPAGARPPISSPPFTRRWDSGVPCATAWFTICSTNREGHAAFPWIAIVWTWSRPHWTPEEDGFPHPPALMNSPFTCMGVRATSPRLEIWRAEIVLGTRRRQLFNKQLILYLGMAPAGDGSPERILNSSLRSTWGVPADTRRRRRRW